MTLGTRLQAAAQILLPRSEGPADYGPTDVSAVLDALVGRVQQTLAADEVWLLLTAVSTVFPTPDEVRATLRELELADPGAGAQRLLERGLREALELGTADRGIRIVTHGVVVDVDFSARNNLHTGIQRVVRSTLPLWCRDRELTATVWTQSRAAMRTLNLREKHRVLRWGESSTALDAPSLGDSGEWTVIVPWRCVVVIPEVPTVRACGRLAALAENSGNHVVAVGYDFIPVVSADLVPAAEPERFVKYLSAVKHMRGVAGISVSATAEFAGFSSMVRTQGLAGPRVFECALPSQTPTELPAIDRRAEPIVVCVGSFEPRKNQAAVLYAAEVLWREGRQFSLHFVGGGGVGRQFPAAVRRLARRGRPVSIETAASDQSLDRLYRSARFTVFTSVHEGYGLPVAESLSHAVPVIATSYGSIREIALPGGARLVDPRDDAALVAQMRTLLSDDAALEALRREIQQRPSRTWQDYADELWEKLVVPELALTRGPDPATVAP